MSGEERQFLSGNEALARGAWEAGVVVASAYPGTPSTEVLETLATFTDVKAEWSTNEKVAFEVAYGAAIGGVRALVSMKHVGLNVAADPLFTSAYAGVNAGFVIVVADDPGMYSSQNEQDSRHYARAARIPVLEPADPQEAHDFVLRAFELSEQWDLPVMIRLTTRVAHTRAPVVLGPRKSIAKRPFQKDWRKYVMIPANARRRHILLEEKIARFRETIEGSPWVDVWKKDGPVGVIVSGVAARYVQEVAPHFSLLKLNLSWPVPIQVIRSFAASFQKIFVVEEGDPFLETELRATGLPVHGKEVFPKTGELTPEIVRQGLLGTTLPHLQPMEVPGRPPALCTGCPHTGVFWALSLLKVPVTGDIGCYTLGALPPYQAMHTTIDMGASIPMAWGMEKAGERAVAVIGDSTFFHSGIPGLIDLVYNQGHGTVIILDNRTTGMTGHQGHPGTGQTPQGKGKEIDIEAVVRAIGVDHVWTVDPHDLKATKRAIQQALQTSEPSVVIARRPCALLPEGRALYRENPHRFVEVEKCVGERCFSCLRIGCPAITVREGRAWIDAVLCVGCGVCEQVCPYGAIVHA